VENIYKNSLLFIYNQFVQRSAVCALPPASPPFCHYHFLLHTAGRKDAGS